MTIHLEEMIQPDLLGCNNWLGHIDRGGYGRWGPGMAHRRVYELHHGAIPPGLTIDHLCGNRRCVRIEHLEAVPIRENLLRSPYTKASINTRKTHCIHGHPFDEINTYLRPTGGRTCRTCKRLRQRAHRRSVARRSEAGARTILPRMARTQRTCSSGQRVARP